MSESTSTDDYLDIGFGKKLKIFFSIHWRGVIVLLVPLLSLSLVFPNPKPFQWCGYSLVVMAIFWVTEALPLPVTSFIPMVVFPLTNIMSTNETAQCYVNSSIFMFLGSMIMANAIEQSRLHIRLALGAIRCIGYSHYKLLFAMCFITMFVSMWITNTAATVMMVPIIFALLKIFEDQKLLKIFETNVNGDVVASDIATCYFCAATFSATIGGIGTIVGTATNLVFKGLFMDEYTAAPEYLSFPLWCAFAIPYMLAMEICMYLWLIFYYFGFLRPQCKAAKDAVLSVEAMEAARIAVGADWKKLGRITFWEIIAIVLFSSAIFGFFTRSPQIFTGWGDSIARYYGIKSKSIADATLALFICFLMLLLPSKMDILKNFKAKYRSQLPKGRIASVIDWNIMNQSLPWSFMFLLGGGFALSQAAGPKKTNMNGEIGKVLKGLKVLPNSVIVLLIIIITVFMTNLASNVAICNVITPIAMTVAKEVNGNPLLYAIASGFSASYCFCLPVGTPGNLVVQGAAKVPTGKMIMAGSMPTITTILLTWGAMILWAPVIWPDIKGFPSWAAISKNTTVTTTTAKALYVL